MATVDGAPHPSGIFSLLDTDLYKLTMQCAVLKFFPAVAVTYNFTNRTPHMKLSRPAYEWLQEQIARLANLYITDEEIAWLRKTCSYFGEEYLSYLQKLRLRPNEQVVMSCVASGDEQVNVKLQIKGLWVETILYEIPLLALISEAYFKFVDTDWDYDGQREKAKSKGVELIKAGCVFSEFGSRRRRDYKTHSLIMQGLCEAKKEASDAHPDWKGKFTGTSNVHMAMRFDVAPIGTVAHEWFMGIAAVTNSYSTANEDALRYWIGTFGRGVLGIALTDTFGTSTFLKSFTRPAPKDQTTDTAVEGKDPTYAQIFTGTRQDSGDPLDFLKMMKQFYAEQGIKDKKVVVYSDSLNVEKCIRYKQATDEAGLTPSFGVGTFFTNDFVHKSQPDEKSVPLNIVIKLAEAEGRPVVKLSDNAGKNMGDSELVAKVKKEVGYQEKSWAEGDEAHRWDKA